jgi:hypothetical protein
MPFMHGVLVVYSFGSESVAHAFPHAPQSLRLFLVSTQTPEQFVRLLSAQTQDPPAHCSPDPAAPQLVPFGCVGVEHVPPLHVPAVWQASIAGQAFCVPEHTPLWHWTFTWHGSPSLHGVPFGCAGFEQVPVVGSHVPTAWHWSLAWQLTGVPVHVPFWHVSPVMQRLPVLHGVPLLTLPVGVHCE